MPARGGMCVTTSAAVNWETRVIRMAPPTRMARFFASVPNVGDCTYCLNWVMPS